MRLAPGMAEAARLAEELGDSDAAQAFWAEDMPAPETQDLSYTGAAGQPQAARFYRGGDGPLVLYIHGGGWVGGSIAKNERACRALAQGGRADVLSVSYRLAPKHPYPAGLEDCRAALAHLRGLFPERPVALGGASAGANLALALALDEEVAGLVLFYGLFSADLTSESHQTFKEGHGLDTARVAELFELYDPARGRDQDPRICPLTASDAALARLPRAFLLAAELDVLRDDTLRLGQRLKALDQPHELHVEAGVLHGFINRGRLVPSADRCLEQAAAFLSKTTEKTPA